MKGYWKVAYEEYMLGSGTLYVPDMGSRIQQNPGEGDERGYGAGSGGWRRAVA